MKQEGIGEITFVGTADPFVAMTITTITGRCAMLLDLNEVLELRRELEAAMDRAFPEGRDSHPRPASGKE